MPSRHTTDAPQRAYIEEAFSIKANGKLLLTGEYVVLDGALALALPVQLGQSLEAQPLPDGPCRWESLAHDGRAWFEASFDAGTWALHTCSDAAIGQQLMAFFRALAAQRPALGQPGRAWHFRTRLDFPRHWGLGSSSTLIWGLAAWAGADPYRLLRDTMGGSGYDIACAGASSPILYQLQDGEPIVKACEFAPTFSEQLYFLFLNRKQNSREGIERYRSRPMADKQRCIRDLSILTHQVLNASHLEQFDRLLLQHEKKVGQFIGLPTAQSRLFPDFWGVVKSLGAWGGDFALVSSERPASDTRQYFQEKGFDTLIPFADLAQVR